MHHTVVISDIHLCEVEPGTGPWMRYRQRAYIPDAEIARMLDAARAKVRGDALTLVLNGDVFDFDAPRVVGTESVFHDLPRSAEHAVPAVAAILDDHPVFVAAIGRVLADGHEVVIISGNHDVQLTLPEVRAIVAARFVEAATAALGDGSSAGPPSARATLAARIHFRAWFHVTPDGVLVEHGHLYDPYCSYRYPMAPYKRGRREIVGTMGSIGTRLLVSRLGYFNPHVESSIMMSKLGYLKHWAQYYLFTRRSISLIWAYGTCRALLTLWMNRESACEARFRGNILACARETGQPAAAIAGHARLFTAPADETLFRCVRELWVDRVALGLVGFALGMAWLIYAGMPWGLLGLLAPLVMLMIYERVYPKPPIEDTWGRVGGAMRQIATLHKARAVVFGHTHNAEASWEDNVFYGNSGSWSAAYHDETCTKPVYQERPLIWLTSDGRGELFGGLWTWKNGTLERRVVRARPEVEEEEIVAAPVSGWQTTAAARESSAALSRDGSTGVSSQEASG
ncbi:metallophosphoesterase [Polyangium aurulentum]|uniref:metallophosphoesterase n=1 Tax=Polyangium aurulentum TaxID=2567896 RepID=UPI0010ADB8B1|nr:metallophosphoesterase [Polyangium aurulentum]UQA55922.1 metallophosphoesterase [Polyangium aurulentum]